jgi:hypothetical protein
MTLIMGPLGENMTVAACRPGRVTENRYAPIRTSPLFKEYAGALGLKLEGYIIATGFGSGVLVC